MLQLEVRCRTEDLVREALRARDDAMPLSLRMGALKELLRSCTPSADTACKLVVHRSRPSTQTGRRCLWGWRIKLSFSTCWTSRIDDRRMVEVEGQLFVMQQHAIGCFRTL